MDYVTNFYKLFKINKFKYITRQKFKVGLGSFSQFNVAIFKDVKKSLKSKCLTRIFI